MSAAQLVELDKESLTFSDKFDHLTLYMTLALSWSSKRKTLLQSIAKKQYDQLHGNFLYMHDIRKRCIAISKSGIKQ